MLDTTREIPDIQESDFTPQDHYRKASFLLSAAADSPDAANALYCVGLAMRQIGDATLKEGLIV